MNLYWNEFFIWLQIFVQQAWEWFWDPEQLGLRIGLAIVTSLLTFFFSIRLMIRRANIM